MHFADYKVSAYDDTGVQNGTNRLLVVDARGYYLAGGVIRHSGGAILTRGIPLPTLAGQEDCKLAGMEDADTSNRGIALKRRTGSFIEGYAGM